MYAPTSIAAIRNPPAPGCYELSHVGIVARTDSPSEPRMYVQDENGGDFSAILAKCSSTSQHVCSPAVRAKIPLLADSPIAGARVSIRGYFGYGKMSGFEEFYIEDVLDECATIPRPAPIALAVADISRDARVPARWYRRATVDVPALDPLVVYDFSPTDLKLTSGACPKWAGFALIPKSAGVAAAAGCADAGALNPTGLASDPREVLIGREFFHQFLYSGDCACAAASRQRLVTTANSVSGPMLGYLLLEEPLGSTVSFQIFEPASDKTFPIH